MLQRLLFSAALVLLFVPRLAAQQTLDWKQIADRPTKEKCVTMQMDSALRSRFPEMGQLDDFEKSLQDRITQIKRLQKTGRLAATLLTIPIVVHVVHNGEAVGTGRNISAAQVQSQIETLNEDFRRKSGTRGFNNNAVGADIEIEFCLAALNPSGAPMAERGINRINGNRNNWSRSDVEGVLKPSSYWDPEKYFNVWVVDLNEPSAGGIVVAYAQFPSGSNLPGIPFTGPASTDGVVINYWSFGNSEKGTFPVLRAPTNLGRTMTHETGHWLGLRHIWGDATCGDDFCADTPPQASESRGCQRGRVSCGNTNMVENYMDYSDDACFNIFTLDQKARIRAVMEISPRRANLIRNNLCGTSVAGKPIPDFRSDRQRVLLGSTVRFTDLSANFPTRWEWTFEGGSPATSSEQNPTVVYNQAGKFKVTLVASNNAGSSEPLVKDQYIEVLNSGLCNNQTNFNGTRIILPQPNGRGYVAGQNSTRIRAVSESFVNDLGYTNLSSATLRFGVAKAARGAETESIVTINVWNARGFQNGPGAILESKEVPLRTILDDVANNRATTVTFERNVPLSGLGYHIGIELTYTAGDTVALVTTKNGESVFATSWKQNSRGDWGRYADSLGINVAHDITARVGMKPSAQVSVSSQFVDPGEAVTLIARGASIFNWKGPNLSTTLGAQVVARPTATTSYTVTGSGLDLCDSTATARIFVRAGAITEVPVNLPDQSLTITPNPSDGLASLSFRNPSRGVLTLSVRNIAGVEVLKQQFQKTDDAFERSLDLRTVPSGMYLIEVRIGDQTVRKKIVKQ